MQTDTTKLANFGSFKIEKGSDGRFLIYEENHRLGKGWSLIDVVSDDSISLGASPPWVLKLLETITQ